MQNGSWLLIGILLLPAMSFAGSASDANDVNFDQNAGISSVVESIKIAAAEKLGQQRETAFAQGAMQPDGNCSVSINGTGRLDKKIKYAEGTYRLDSDCHPVLVSQRRLADVPPLPVARQPPFESQVRSASQSRPQIPLKQGAQKDVRQCEMHVQAKDAHDLIMTEVINATKWEWDYEVIQQFNIEGQRTRREGWYFDGEFVVKAEWVYVPTRGRTYALSKFYCENDPLCPNGRDYNIGMYALFEVTYDGLCYYGHDAQGTLPPGSYFTWYVFSNGLSKN